MKQIVMMLCACLMVGGIDAAAAKPKKELKPAQTILLYPEGQAAGKGLPEAEGPLVSNGYTADKEVRAENGNLTCTGDNARMEIYTPKKPNGQMVTFICSTCRVLPPTPSPAPLPHACLLPRES